MKISNDVTKKDCLRGLQMWSTEVNNFFKYLEMGESHEKNSFDYAVTCMDNLICFFLIYKLFYK